MTTRLLRLLASGCALLGAVIITAPVCLAQGTPPSFDSAAIESATTITGGVCSNSAVGISYRLPANMRAVDATALRQAAYRGSAARGIGPEARYILWAKKEKKSAALLCGAAGQDGEVQVIALPAALIQAGGPASLAQLITGLGRHLGAQPSVRQATAGELRMECADTGNITVPTPQGKRKISNTTCAGVWGSYAVMWILTGYSEDTWKNLVAGINSVQVRPPLAPPVSTSSSPAAVSHVPPAADFQSRLDAFLKAWLVDANIKDTMAFFAPAAYSAPSLIGNYCGGWYRAGAPQRLVASRISENLMGVPGDYPKGTPAAAMFKAWDRLPGAWIAEAANDVAKDHFLVAALDAASLDRIFSGDFAASQYGRYLRQQIAKSGNGYWVVFPDLMSDGDVFVIFTAWQKSGGGWRITDMDVVCQ